MVVDVHGWFKLRVYESISWVGAWVEDGVGDACCGEGCLFYGRITLWCGAAYLSFWSARYFSP